MRDSYAASSEPMKENVSGYITQAPYTADKWPFSAEKSEEQMAHSLV